MTHHRRPEVRARLARAHGHLHGVIEMVDESRPYPEILQQIIAVKAALEKATAVAMDDMISACQEEPKGKASRSLEDLRTAVRTLA